MLFDAAPADSCVGDELILKPQRARWGVDSEYGRLLDVGLLPPAHPLPEWQHLLIQTLEVEGVRCRLAQPSPDTRSISLIDQAALMTPWGLLALNSSGVSGAETWGLPRLGILEEGRVNASDVCILRPGLVAIGWSGESTDESGARALARLFEARGWRAIVTRFDPYFSRLDTLFTLVDRKRAVACLEALDPAFVNRLWMLGLELVPMTIGEVQTLGANIVCLGGNRILSATENSRINRELARRGHDVIAVESDQLTRDSGGLRRLLLPLAREPG
jgi:arginine deiminase